MSSSKLSVGIVGLPNVGKSTLFNAISGLQVEAANYPFATIEPNVGVVTVPEPRLDVLARIEKSKKTVPTVIEFKDIAGLVAGAHKGEGLGNQFLAHVREVDAIVEVVRFFEDKNITHVSGNVDPKRDIETIETELILADLQLVEKKNENFKKSARSGKHEDIVKAALAQKYFDALSAGRLASSVSITEEEQKFMFEFPFLTNKPILYVANVKSGETAPDNFLALDAQIESEIAQIPENERKHYLKELGLAESGLDRLIKAAYQTLGLQTFFTAGEQETRAWTITKGDKTPQAAGKIHTDFEKGFIKADVVAYDKFVEAPGWVKAREKGWARSEGKEYVVQDGDIMLFKFNV
ncbi:MAG: redox-regulated ATPase YchF [Candidatus Doudnabacteria bacterium RIFCSPHIGHO2_02_FULL_48_21]|nr:MAG: redox-regulated ATPase YchF [Candidatus Doudnabacteria bacterium RIFCSPHIGHO2_01_48_18]OGE77476.1 MAG: redox-regulated ATPase YchF [Candidatus Doudnabacteria bacterium RIFCSPHIGHO2_01_FULL_48_180]OGE91545.1 MAG: redox-regulated ATPase YchF [Candidatus Doudnabacteria bacterium RIFCSPHIGHO2_12_FULL_47_25]OGE93135.1 MAG: redox-regulated ATPase YchF [Candidatus Doudnabacteria bacterium RIFCSPHIGHO2_02_FULL_48_21]OGE97267.1 MAG: redox-regulated ATPase YchF [Candidatus Doudnabacteria bacteriu